MKYFNRCFFTFLSLHFYTVLADDTLYDVRLLAAKPKLFLPVIHSPLEQREAKITAQEYSIGQKIRPLLEKNDYKQVLSLLSQHNDKAKKISPALHLLTAQIQLQLKQYVDAEKSYLSALKIMPDLVRAHEGLSVLYITLEQTKKAQQALIKAINLGLSNSQTYGQLAYLYMKLNKPLSAVSAYQQALILDPDNKNIMNGLLFSLTASKQFAMAAILIDEKLISNASDTDLWIQRANLALAMKDTAKALSSVEVAIRLGNTNPETYQLAAQTHLTQKNYYRTVKLLKKFIDLHGLPMNMFDQLITWLLKEKQWDNADILVKKINVYVETKQSNDLAGIDKSRLWYYQGVIATSKNDSSNAEQLFKRAIATDPGNGDALLSLAKLSLELNKTAYAEILYQRAERLEHVKQQAMLGRAQIYIDQKDYQQALTLLRQAKKDYPQRHDLNANIQTLAKIVNTQI